MTSTALVTHQAQIASMMKISAKVSHIEKPKLTRAVNRPSARPRGPGSRAATQQAGVGQQAEHRDGDPGELGVLALLDRLAAAADDAGGGVALQPDGREIAGDGQARDRDDAEGDPQRRLVETRGHSTWEIASSNSEGLTAPTMVLVPLGPVTMKVGVWETSSAFAWSARSKKALLTASLS